MNTKSVFLNNFLHKEVYVKQSPTFEKKEKANHVYKLTKALYGLKQGPRTWYKRLSNFLVKNSFICGNVDITLFIKTIKHDILIV